MWLYPSVEQRLYSITHNKNKKQLLSILIKLGIKEPDKFIKK